MLHGLCLKLTVIHIRAVIRLIGNGTDDQIGVWFRYAAWAIAAPSISVQ